MYKKGDILLATQRTKETGKHPIIYHQGFDDVNFIGGMLTHMPNAKNIPMKKEHFKILMPDKFKYDSDTHLVKAKLMKFETWGPFTKVAELTDEGINFVTENIDGLVAETWEEYLDRNN